MFRLSTVELRRQPWFPTPVCLRSQQGLLLDEEPDVIPERDRLRAPRVRDTRQCISYFSIEIPDQYLIQQCWVTMLTMFYRKQEKEEEKDIRMWIDPQRGSVYSIKWRNFTQDVPLKTRTELHAAINIQVNSRSRSCWHIVTKLVAMCLIKLISNKQAFVFSSQHFYVK